MVYLSLFVFLLFTLEIVSQETVEPQEFIFPSLYTLTFNKVLCFLATKEIAKKHLASLPSELADRINMEIVPFKKSLKKIKKCNGERQIMLHCLQEEVSEKTFLDIDIMLKFKSLFSAAIPHEIADVVSKIAEEKIDITSEDISNVVAIKASVNVQKNIALHENFFKQLLWKIMYDGKGSIDKVLVTSSCFVGPGQNNVLTAEVLLLLGADVDVQMELPEYDNRVFSPISMARCNNNKEIVTLLLQHGANDIDRGKNV